MSFDTKANDILIYGNTACLSRRDILTIAPGRRTAVVGAAARPGVSGRIRWFKMAAADKAFLRLFQVYDFETVIFVSGYLTFGSEPANEIEDLRHLLHQCRKYGLKRGIILFPQDLCVKEHTTSRWMELGFMEDLCRHYCDGSMKIQLVRCPFPASTQDHDTYFYRMFQALTAGSDWEFPRSGAEKTDFITQEDLNVFLQRLLDQPAKQRFEQMDLRCYSKYTYAEAAKILEDKLASSSGSGQNSSEKRPHARPHITCSEKEKPAAITYGPDLAREQLGWFARQDVFDHLDDLLADFYADPPKKQKSRQQSPALQQRRQRGKAALEVILGAGVMEALTLFLRNSVQFRLIDVRLLYVVLLSSVYGLHVGFFAALFACVSLAASYFSRGIQLQMLFFQPDNWLAFILYLTVASVCGLVRDRHEEEKKIQADQIAALQQENEYTGQLYDEAVEYKNEYRQNLIQSRDGFGRIFDAVQRLAVKEPTQIYGEAVNVLEDILDNDSVAIYSVEKNEKNARLEVSSGRMTQKLSKTISLKKDAEIMQSVSKEIVWVNRKLEEDKPVYAMGILSEGKVRILIFLYEAKYTQMNAYYSNLLRVLCGLIQRFMLEAWAYQEATSGQNHIGETALVTPAAFETELRLRRDLADQAMASYCVIRIQGDGKSAQQMDHILEGKLWSGDITTMDQKNGDFYVLAQQTNATSQAAILERLGRQGLSCSVVEAR